MNKNLIFTLIVCMAFSGLLFMTKPDLFQKNNPDKFCVQTVMPGVKMCPATNQNIRDYCEKNILDSFCEDRIW